LPPANTRAELAVPLIFGGQVMGVLDVQSDRRGAFSEDDRSLFEALADNVAIAIRNANLYYSEQWRRHVADSLREVAGLLSSDLALDQVLDAVLTELERTLPCDVAAIWLLDDDDTSDFGPAGRSLHLGAVHGDAADDVVSTSDLAPDAGPWLTEALRADQPTIRTPQSPFEPLGAALEFPPDYSAIAAPLRVGDRRLGVLTLAHRTPERYGAESGAMAAAFASYAAVAIENARLYQEAQEQAYVSAALLQVAQAVVSLNDLDDILSAIVRITPILVGVERCIIILWDAERSVFRPMRAYGVPHDAEATLLARRYAPGDFPLLDAVREHGGLLTYPATAKGADLRTDAPNGWDDLVPPDFAAEFAECPPGTRYPWGAQSPQTMEYPRGKVCSLLAVPLSVKGDVLGVMLLEEIPAAARRFRERRLEIITGIAQQAAMAVQNDRLQQEMAGRERLERELQLAREIQRTFMPSQLPNLPGWEMAVTWRAAHQVGGDFYDFFELPGGQLGLVIADVADKGMPAALFMALTRALVRAAALEEASPAAALAHVNDLLVPDAQHGMFVTAVYAMLSLETGRLVYANAGHNPPLLVRTRTHEMERLERGGMALGVLEGMPMGERAVSLEPGDCVVFYTDGITEAFSPQGDVYGEDRLRMIIQSADCASAQAMLDTVDDSVIAFVGDNPPSDDMTLMVLRRLAA
jgi:serine phosphatase RsbU (regulator of sigma subunit)